LLPFFLCLPFPLLLFQFSSLRFPGLPRTLPFFYYFSGNVSQVLFPTIQQVVVQGPNFLTCSCAHNQVVQLRVNIPAVVGEKPTVPTFCDVPQAQTVNQFRVFGVDQGVELP
jgi:hypothetical protein